MTQATDKLIGPVPSSIVNSARSSVTPYEGRVAEFNVATWLHLPGLANLPVSLLVNYRDGSQQREVAVDHGKVNLQSKVMLSGIARLPFKQKIEDMQIRLRCAVQVQGLIVEELFVQAVELSVNPVQQALA
ncbi:hypothetical protein A9179_15825 [Pseudomonas alcaligenes]|uniref:Uncharacterized protein n=1 Tax=Aquipseudomonas alcaligenes TaxID=43263 RepID=A0ABR7S2D1_AQUAC|nr:hypothetical protein [Pseudomonas alcaligenes]MBC9251740.1 hypothetical protein [Pseudomonas alcaligenes]